MDPRQSNSNSENSNENVTPEDIVRKHMENKDHVITDEEIKSVKVGVVDAEQQEAIDETLNEVEENEKNDKDIPNPYDVLEE